MEKEIQRIREIQKQWEQYGLPNMILTPERYLISLQEQIGKPLTAKRLAEALAEDSGTTVSEATASRILADYPEVRKNA